MQKGDLVVVDAPAQYANSSLNGSMGKVYLVGSWIVNVFLVSGQHAGREWQFNPQHVRLANKRMHLTALRRWWASRLSAFCFSLAYRLREIGGR